MDQLQIAWLAGLFEGEGNLDIAKNGGTRVTIRMTDLDVIERVHALIPCTQIHVIERKPMKTQFAWRISNPDKVREFISLVLPWLGERRKARALEVLHHLDTRLGTGGFNKAKTHCAEGHEYSPENTYIRPGTDHRHCRACRNQWAREYAARKRQAAQRAEDGTLRDAA